MTQERTGNLLHNLLLFGRLLRGLGLDVNPGRMIDLVQALGYIEIGNKADFYHAARSLLIHKQEDIAIFDQAFERFWRKPADGWFTIEWPATAPLPKRPLFVPPALNQPADPSSQAVDGQQSSDETLEIIEVTRTYSTQEQLRHKDFGELTGEELAAIKRLMAQLVWQLGQRRTRRQRPGRGVRFDLRRSLRRNLRYGGEVLEWPRLQPKYKPRPLVILADISGSMERYTRLLLHFLYSLAEGLDQQVEVFVFSTRLTRITRQLRGRNVDRALREVSLAVPDWSGGTRIGDALKVFNFAWGRRVLGRGAVVLLISDGWDRGDPMLLGQELGRLQRSCHRLVWLNPLLGSPQYEPLTRGMQAALPYIDDFLPVDNLASLQELAAHLATLEGGRPGRRQNSRRG
jgi:uncharacterized protein